jgi:hypothetical protein
MSIRSKYPTNDSLRLSQSPRSPQVKIKQEPCLFNEQNSEMPANNHYFPIHFNNPSFNQTHVSFPSSTALTATAQTTDTNVNQTDSMSAAEKFLQLLDTHLRYDVAPTQRHRETDTAHHDGQSGQSGHRSPVPISKPSLDKFRDFRGREQAKIQKRLAGKPYAPSSRLKTYWEGQNIKLKDQNRKMRFRISELQNILNSLQGRFNALRDHLCDPYATSWSIEHHADQVQFSLDCGKGVVAKAGSEFDQTLNQGPDNLNLPY